MSSPAGWPGKRAFDLTVAALLTLVTMPVSAVIALWVKSDAGRPVIFKQERVGFAGQPFTMFKFRTMVNDAVEVGREQGITTSDPFGVVLDDPRITRSGAFLRRTSLDELPQLLNVLRGDMSLVGPRPDIPQQAEHYSAWERERLLARPGITGVAQVSGRDEIPWTERIAMDRAYVRNVSVMLDLRILVRTVLEVFRDEPRPLLDDLNAASRIDDSADDSAADGSP